MKTQSSVPEWAPVTGAPTLPLQPQSMEAPAPTLAHTYRPASKPMSRTPTHGWPQGVAKHTRSGSLTSSKPKAGLACDRLWPQGTESLNNHTVHAHSTRDEKFRPTGDAVRELCTRWGWQEQCKEGSIRVTGFHFLKV